ncbi:Flagellar hook-associated protein FlgK [Thermogutta terrifontis]|uniref:Flagellar hook-associated protein 1 n=1 Tax=Thermogutta terrifontis TaxID=1331910 RepID=A0A286RLX7_9BACT|nr:flagellar hook-associated protein FlgK [Thermogutta terrifontis]ASV76950.1 Flagellar hook-associated protein FlgK [Thermogutta terrifontis]
MSLFSAIRMASNTLRADQIALQVAGQNIANAETPGYIREEVILKPAPIQKLGGLPMGLGVEVAAVIQKIDHFLEERLRASVSDRAGAEVREQTFHQLEGLIGELNETDLSSDLTRFFASISEILNQPESTSARNLAVLQGQTLTQNIRRLYERVNQVRSDLNSRVDDIADRINKLIEDIRRLNIRIAETEGGDVSQSDAVGLRDQRLQDLEELASLIDIRVEEQPSGGVAVYSGGFFLVYEGTARQVSVARRSDRGLAISEIRLDETNSPLEVNSGELHGLLVARDSILGGFLDQLNEFSAALISGFNQLFSSGQGLTGFSTVTSTNAVVASDIPLDSAGLPFPPRNGSFQIQLYNTQTGTIRTYTIRVDLLGHTPKTTLQDIADQINAIDGLSASIDAGGRLTIRSTSSDQVFAFANDTSGLLAGLGINTFFTGSNAGNIGINPVVASDPSKFAASRGGIGADTQLAEELAGFGDKPLDDYGGLSLHELYDRMVAEVTQGSAIAKAEADSARTFENTLRGQKLAVSGVNLDEEVVKLIAYQRQFQVSARFIKTLNDLIEILVSI